MSTNGTVAYVSRFPTCDMHKYVMGDDGVIATYDGKTKLGPWANMCPACFEEYGTGLGIGKGQRLQIRK